jgi:trigger factor
LKTETVQRDDHQVQLIAEVDQETLERYKRSAARKISSSTRIAGFRPGKAPYDIVRRQYGDQAIYEEAVTLMLDEIYPAAVAEAKITPAGPGKLEEVLQADPPKFSFIVPLAAEIDLGDYRAVRADYNPPVVDDEKLDEVLRRLQRRSAVTKPVERPAQEGDLVYLKVSGRLLEPNEGADPVLVPETARQMIAGDARDYTDAEGNEWPFPGFSAALLGFSANEEKVLPYTFPMDGSDDDLSGKLAEFTVKAETVHELELHPLDDEFAQSLGAYETMEKLRENIQADLQREESTRYNRDYVESVILQILEKATVKYAPTELETEIEHTVSAFEDRLGRDHMDLETYLKTREMTREEFIEKEAREVAEAGLRRRLILDEFAARENIQISDEEVQMIYNMSQNQARQDPSLKSLAKGKTTKKDVGESLARRTINEIFNQRMINRLREIATGKADEAAEAAAEISDPAAEVPAEMQAEVSEPVVEVPNEVPADVSADIIVEQPVETAAESSEDAPASEENTGETSQAAE